MNKPFVTAGPSSQSDSELNPSFMHDENCMSIILDWIHGAQKSIILQAYSFSSQLIADALISAKQKGIIVKVFIDKNAEEKKNNLIQMLRSNKIEIKVDQHPGKAHNKVMIIDDEYVITGSYNWTDTRFDHNSDVIIFIKDECVNRLYKNNYNLKIGEKMIYYRSSSIRMFALPQPNCCTVSLNGYPIMSVDDGFVKDISKNEKKKEMSENYVKVNVCFPNFSKEDCMLLIANYIRNAKSSIFIQAASLTHEKISEELITAHHHKYIDVKLLVEGEIFHDRKEKVNDLIYYDIIVKLDKTGGIAHSKTLIIDDDIVLSGSLNLTCSAQNSNFENLLQLKNRYVNEMFKKHFMEKWNQGEELRQMYTSKKMHPKLSISSNKRLRV